MSVRHDVSRSGNPNGRAAAPLQPDQIRSIYRDHAAFVFRLLQASSIDDATLDEAVQDVFLVAFRRWGERKRDHGVRSWLAAIARRVASDHRRKRLRIVRRESAGLASVPPPSPEDVTATRQMLAAVERVAEILSPEQREAFFLGVVEGMTAKEIGEALGINPNTVYSRIHHARRAFTVALASLDGG